MTRAVVIKAYGDPRFAGAIVEGVTRRVIPLDSEELAAVKAELAAVKAAKARQDARDGVRKAGDDKRWALIKADLARDYAVKRPGPVREALLLGWAMIWSAIYQTAEELMRWNREGYR